MTTEDIPDQSEDPSVAMRAGFVEIATAVAGVCGFVFGVFVIPVLVRPEAPHTTAIFAAGVFASILCSLGFWAIRRGHQEPAIACVVVAATMGPIIASPSSPLILGYIPVAVGIASLTLSASMTGLVGMFSFIAPILASTWLADWDLTSGVVLGSANLTTSGLLLVVRGWNERLRDAAAQQRDKEAKLEDQLREARRLEAVGQLAGGVAHDLNNYMTVILGCVDLADPDHEHELLGEVRTASNSATNLIGQLLAYARRQPRNPEPLDIVIVLGAIDRLLRKLARDDTTFTMELPDDAWVLADRTQIEQVFINLVANASQAVQPGAGRITLTIAHDGPDVRIEVEDNGRGIEPQTRDRIFEPFY
ncbi:MAG: ATP-binding protein, partial [Myxococcota bacterium]